MPRWISLFAAFVWLLAASGMAPAQDAFPSRPVHLLVPFAPGGAVDIVARTLERGIVEALGPGGGRSRTAPAPAAWWRAGGRRQGGARRLHPHHRGHRCQQLNPYLYAKLPYDTFNDFTPLSLIGTSPNMLLVRADSAFKTIADLIAAARAQPGQISYGHAGNGTSSHLAGELLKYMAKIDITSDSLQGRRAPALADLIGGHIPATFATIFRNRSRRSWPARCGRSG